jgi:hypothetical protein
MIATTSARGVGWDPVPWAEADDARDNATIAAARPASHLGIAENPSSHRSGAPADPTCSSCMAKLTTLPYVQMKSLPVSIFKREECRARLSIKLVIRGLFA